MVLGYKTRKRDKPMIKIEFTRNEVLENEMEPADVLQPEEYLFGIGFEGKIEELGNVLKQKGIRILGIYINCHKEKWGEEGICLEMCGSACCAKAYVKDIERRQFQHADLSNSGRSHSLTGFNIEKDNNDVNEIRGSS
ncbi:hypothetical protein BY996DRAFT_6506126 [Phakopsora pachyrhizi]|nr:hypothetical protein BY996DRAFT_6506126 [Phakopsora pachyrhizi]